MENITSKNLSSITVDEYIRQIEVTHDLLKYEIEGWSAWCILRFPVQLKLFHAQSTSEKSIIKNDYRNRWQRGYSVLRAIAKLITVKQKSYFVKSYTSGLAEKEGEKYKDIWFDDLLIMIGNYIKVESINNLQFAKRRSTALVPSNILMDDFNFIIMQVAKIGFPSYINHVSQNIGTCLEKEFGDLFSTEWVKSELIRFYWLKRFYTVLLYKVNPQFVLTVDPGEYALVAAAKERSIKVVEFQHGFLDRYHSAYSWTTYALNYKQKMPVPDYIFLYGIYWKKELDVYGFWGNSLRSVGSLRIDSYRHHRTNLNRPSICNLLVTTQGIHTAELITFMSEFLTLAHDILNLRLTIKLHPGYDRDKTPYFMAFHTDERVEIIEGPTALSTFELLTMAHIHVSISSTCHYEAIALGVPTVILPIASHEIVLPLYQVGHAFLVHTPKDLLNLVVNWQTLKVPQGVDSYYFQLGALENIKKELMELA
ncbi:MAG: hypothetical protein R3E79_31950 [Caldilineaceae bacterium]